MRSVYRRADRTKLTLAALWMTAGLLVALAPWAARNAHTLGRTQFLAPRYAETFGDYVPEGFYAWTKTWQVRFRLLARERAARNPLRIYLRIPLSRAAAMWLTPRVELLPYSGKLSPPGKAWRDNRTDFLVSAGLGLLGIVYLGLAFAGSWRCRRYPAMGWLAAFVLLRTAALTQLQTIEPRYVLECFPILLALGGIALALSFKRYPQTADRTPADLYPLLPSHLTQTGLWEARRSVGGYKNAPAAEKPAGS